MNLRRTRKITILLSATILMLILSVMIASAAPPYISTPNVAIPDNTPAGVTDTIIIADSGTITDLDVRLDISHSWIGDLIVTLEHQESFA